MNREGNSESQASSLIYRFSEQRLEYGFFIPKTETSFRLLGPKHPGCPGPSERLFPATYEYQGGEVMEFASGIGAHLAQVDVAEELVAKFRGFEIKPANFNSGPKRPYRGPALVELWATFSLDHNPNQSTLVLEYSCKRCGKKRYGVQGVQTEPEEVEINGRWIPAPGKPRRKGHGIIATEREVGHVDVFRFGGWMMCIRGTVRDYILDRGWRNVKFLEYGEIRP